MTSTECVEGEDLFIEGADARHLTAVLRVRPGDTVTAADGTGWIYEAEINRTAPSRVDAAVTSRRYVEEVSPRIRILQGLPKAEKAEEIVQKLTEIGASYCVLFGSQRSVARWDRAKSERALQRLGLIAREATKQSRRARVPSVSIASFTEVLSLLDKSPPEKSHTRLVAWEEERDVMLRSALPQVTPDEMSVVIGPEGGLDRDEVEAFRQRGALSFSLGEHVLRTQTAGPTIAALLLFHYGALG